MEIKICFNKKFESNRKKEIKQNLVIEWRNRKNSFITYWITMISKETGNFGEKEKITNKVKYFGTEPYNFNLHF